MEYSGSKVALGGEGQDTFLKTKGEAAVVLPENVLFGSGASETVSKKLLETTDFHTILPFTNRDFLCQWCKSKCVVL